MAIDLLTFPGLAGSSPAGPGARGAGSVARGAAGGVTGLVHGVTQRPGGVSRGSYGELNLGRSSGDAPEHVAENGRRLAAALGATGRVRFPHQVHGRAVVVLDAPPDAPLPEADAVLTDVPGLAVGVLGADCPGVLVVDPVRRALAVVHSGWRGTVAGVLVAAVEAMVRRYGTDVADLRVGIGPGISARRYEVGPDVAEPFLAALPFARGCVTPGRGDRVFLDLVGALRRQAEACGVPAGRIEAMDLCTFDARDRLFSHRRDGAATGRHGLVAMWTPDPT